MESQQDSNSTGASSYAVDDVDTLTQEDILSIAAQIADIIELGDLAVCLKLSLENIDKDDTKGNQVVTLLLQWQSRHSESSRTKLFGCLRKLKNPNIEEILKTFESNDEVSKSSNQCLVLKFPNVPKDGNTSPLCGEARSQELFSLAVQENTALAGVSQELIYGQRTPTGILRFRSNPELFTKVEVTRKIADMEKRFSELLCDVRKHLEQVCSEDDVKDIKLYLTALSVSIEEDTSPKVFTSHQAEIITYSKLTQIFQWLSIHGFWSFLNFYLLDCLVEKYGSDTLKVQVKGFTKDMEEFKKETKLVDFLPAWSGRSPHIAASGFEPIILRVNNDWSDCTLANVSELEGFLESRFLINRFLLRFANGHPGSVVIMWLAPSHAVVFLRKKIKSVDNTSLDEVGITEITFGCNITIKASSSTIQRKVYTAVDSNEATASQSSKTLLDHGNFKELYSTSIKDPQFFWGTLAKQFLEWYEPFEKVMDCIMENGDIKWFTNGKLNVSGKYPDRVALIWEKDEPGQTEKVTYKQLLEKVCQIANVLKSKGVKKGDLVAIYMPICPLAVAAMLACARIGAVHSVLFSTFSLVKDEQRNKLLTEWLAGAKLVITANATPLNGTVLKLKDSLEAVLANSSIQHVLVFKRMEDQVSMKLGRDEWLEEAMVNHPTECKPEFMDSEDDLFVMFTSGLTGEPKGVVHTQAGYLLYVAVTHKYYFDYQPGEIFACTADIGWITGHSYVVYGPLCNGATTVLFDSTAIYPSADRYWNLVQKHSINHFYSTPCAIQKLMSLIKVIPNSFDLSSLRIIGSVGECLKPEAWEWFYRRFGNCKCPLLDTWWQTELGGIALSPHPHQKPVDHKHGKSMKPSFGVVPCVIDNGVEQAGNEVTGVLYLEAPLPGMGRRLLGSNGSQLFKEQYFKYKFGKRLFYTSDVVHRDKDGDYQIYGRVDDAIRYNGELLNLPVIEGAANASHESIEETLLMAHDKCNTKANEEPDVVAHVQVKRMLSVNTEKEVIFKIQESIEGITQIKKEKIEVKLHEHDVLSGNTTFSGKTKRQAPKSTYPESEQWNGGSEGVEAGHKKPPWMDTPDFRCISVT